MITFNKLIAECTAYDFKESVEIRKPKSWLKSVSAFANGTGGSLFFGIADDKQIIGLANIHEDAEIISEKIRDCMDPAPDVELLPLNIEGKDIIGIYKLISWDFELVLEQIAERNEGV